MTTRRVTFTHLLCDGLALEVEATVDLGQPERNTPPGDPGDDPQVEEMEITIAGNVLDGTIDVSSLGAIDVSSLFVNPWASSEFKCVEDLLIERAIEVAEEEEV